MLILGIDTGGTFTDFVLQSEQGLKTYKLPSTPDDPSRAIIQGLNHFFGRNIPDNLEIIHGSTVATNAFLERKGAKTLLITTSGFEDVLFIGRQNRARLYDFNVTRPIEIIPRSMVVGVKERMLYDGTVLKAPGRTVSRRLRRICRERKIEAVAVCFLHSYANDAHETYIKEKIRTTGIAITLSAEILPEFREYERLTTTLINAYLGPVISTYIKRLSRRLGNVPLHIQQSNGGILPAPDIENRAVNTLLSGPAGGVHGAHQLAGEMGLEKLITFDMGGTSTDVSLCDGRPTLTRDHKIDGYPIRIEVMDIHTVGAGGGSLARIDPGGLLKVGPESAGARPGPICYGVGGKELTVTDANLFLGRLLPDRFMGGAMKLQTQQVETAMKTLAEKLGLDPVATALGIIRIVNASMAKAVRAVSLERGYDPKEFALFAFGGASGLHCCELARELAVEKIVVPARAGILSAQGMVFADPVMDYMQTLFLTGEELESGVLGEKMEQLVNRGMKDTAGIGGNVQKSDITVEKYLNLRYQGQAYEICIPYKKNFIELFHQAHEHNFGYRLEEKPLELISIQCSVRINREKTELPREDYAQVKQASPVSYECMRFDSGTVEVPVYDRKHLFPGQGLKGPALIVDNYTTVLLTDDFSLTVDTLLNLIIERNC
ncbi:MAG: hydantoinase/oxoprolinase family protein [Deltaproteobacteria bacterium]|jgi:N-methylhydantoinase A|nr:hydantoinase/oxoprolinase family protein [Deltaproteobacteria bacterium]